MITGVIKNKIDKIWTDIWAGGLTMPFKVIEQITYLMFIRSLDQKEIKNEKKAAAFKMRGIKGKVEMIFPENYYQLHEIFKIEKSKVPPPRS